MSRPVEERERIQDPQLLSIWEGIRDINHIRSINYYKEPSLFHPSSYKVGRKEVSFSFIYEKAWQIARLLQPMNFALKNGTELSEEEVKLFFAGTAGMTILDPNRYGTRRRRDFAISRNASGLVCVVLESTHQVNSEPVNPLVLVSTEPDLYRRVLNYQREPDDNPYRAITRSLAGGEAREMEAIVGLVLPYVRATIPPLRVLPYEHFVKLK